MGPVTALLTFAAGVAGIVLGGLLARRNEKQAEGDRLLIEALNDAITAIADVASGAGDSAQRRYASATSRIALHASPRVVTTFRQFQDDATTATTEGRRRLVAAVQASRSELGKGSVEDGDLAVLLSGEPSRATPATDQRVEDASGRGPLSSG